MKYSLSLKAEQTQLDEINVCIYTIYSNNQLSFSGDFPIPLCNNQQSLTDKNSCIKEYNICSMAIWPGGVTDIIKSQVSSCQVHNTEERKVFKILTRFFLILHISERPRYWSLNVSSTSSKATAFGSTLLTITSL